MKKIYLLMPICIATSTGITLPLIGCSSNSKELNVIINDVNDVGITLDNTKAIKGQPFTGEFNWPDEGNTEINSIIIKVGKRILVQGKDFQIWKQNNLLQIFRGDLITDDINITIDVQNTIDFNTCDWKYVVDACNKLENGQWTEEKFCDRFTFGDQKPTKLDDFIGQKRYIYLNGHETTNKHEVIVVGCQQDYLDEDQQHPVALTFQFNTLISDANGKQLETIYADDASGNKDYWWSRLNNSLNSQYNVAWYQPSGHLSTETKSVLSMIKESDIELANGIKEVCRGINIYDTSIQTTPKFKLSYQPTKLFAPTLSNYFSKIGIESSDSEIVSENHWSFYEAEGQPHNLGNKEAQYEYYRRDDKIADEPIVVEIEEELVWSYFDFLILSDASGEILQTSDYWLSSPWLTNDDTTSCSWNVKIDDQLGDISGCMHVNDVSYKSAIAPCFCI